VFESSHPFLLFDYFRVPYAVTETAAAGAEVLPAHRRRGVGVVRPLGRDRGSLLWPLGGADMSSVDPEAPPGRYEIEGIPIFCRIVRDADPGPWLGGDGGNWTAVTGVTDATGAAVASIRSHPSGSVLVPFDPGEVITNFWSERYRAVGRLARWAGLRTLAKRSYYRVRPLLPRPAQIRLRRLLSRLQQRTAFPRWPVETALHDFYELLFRMLASVAGEPIPTLAPWPSGFSWSLVLTHDVETEVGYRNLHLLREREERAGFRSSWNFVPKRYTVDDRVVRELQAAGFEVGVHGLYHDGRDLESLPLLRERLPAIRAYAERWNAVGFRSPATHRRWEWMPLLGFAYDSSYPDTDPFEPDAGGCCSWLPFFNENLVELPITLPQDYTLFVILRRQDETAWVEKANFLKGRGGLALLITHPDYLLSEPLLDIYSRYLETFRADTSVWRALPRDVADWWRRRAASELRRQDGGWEIGGPAARDGRVQLLGEGPPAPTAS
jgi:hypothetical protein